MTLHNTPKPPQLQHLQLLINLTNSLSIDTIVRIQNTEDRGRKTEDRGQNTEDRRRMTDVRYFCLSYATRPLNKSSQKCAQRIKRIRCIIPIILYLTLMYYLILYLIPTTPTLSLPPILITCSNPRTTIIKRTTINNLCLSYT